MRKLFLFFFLAVLAKFGAAQTDHLVISQVYGGGGNSGATFKNDFIEIFNPTNTTVSLNGWSVQYASATGTSWSNRINLKDSIRPGQYYLIQAAAGTGGTVSLPAPDATGSINLSGTTGKLALVKSTTVLPAVTCPAGEVIVDFIGFGGANCYEGAGAAPALTNSTAAFRKEVCKDENNNATDFEARTPSPRNTQSAPSPCTTGADLTAPGVKTWLPLQGATGVAPGTLPAIQFTEPVLAHNGQVVVRDLTRGTEQTIGVNDPAVVINGATLTLQLTLKPNRSYAITLSEGLVKDAAGNLFGGSTEAWTFATGDQQLVFDFNNCNGANLSGGFQQYSVSGTQKWECLPFGQTGNALQINGFSGGAQENEDWLISPAFDFSGFSYPLLTYATRSRFAGPGLRLLVSSNYSGTGDPGQAVWTELNGRFPAVDSDVWTTTGEVNLAQFKGAENVYIAFVYRAAPESGASRWTVDDFRIENSETAPLPNFTFGPAELDFDYVPSGSTAAPQPMTIGAYNLRGDLAIKAPAGFELSADGSSFGAVVTLPQAAAESGRQTVHVRFAPSAADTEYKGVVQVTSAGLDKPATALAASSLRALKVVNWNIEWFGSPEQNPSNDALQQQNVQTILQRLNADIYALSEVVDTLRLQQVVANMPGYSYTVSDFGSYTDNTADPDYATAQKLAFVYRTDVVQKIDAYGVLRNGGSAQAFYNWSSGRFPYLMQAQVTLEGVRTTVDFVLLHGKANTGNNADKVEAWERRKGAADELKDSLDRYRPFGNVVLLGDFNDDFDQTIAPNIPGNVSSYISFLADSLRYLPVTRPLSLAGLKSTVSNDNVIDHQLVSNEMGVAYVPGSAKVLTGVASWVSSYGSTTTDHYPVMARYDLRYFARPIAVQAFTGAADGSTVRFSWTTAHQINSGYFVIERSRNGKDFAAVDSVAGTGDSRTLSRYALDVQKPWPGQSHYRLRIVSLDGTVAYSPAVTINMKSNSHLLQVNPSRAGSAVVTYTIPEKEKATLQLIDVNGRSYYKKEQAFTGGTNIRTLDTQHLPAGIYFVRIIHATGIETEKVFLGR